MYNWLAKKAFHFLLDFLATRIHDVCSPRADLIDKLGEDFIVKFREFQIARTLHGCGKIPPPGV